MKLFGYWKRRALAAENHLQTFRTAECMLVLKVNGVPQADYILRTHRLEIFGDDLDHHWAAWGGTLTLDIPIEYHVVGQLDED